MQTDSRSDMLDALFAQYYGDVYRACNAYVNNNGRFRECVEESVQEAFVLAWIYYDDLRNHPSPIGWIVSAATNRLRSEVRNVRKRDKASIPVEKMSESKTDDFTQAAIDRWLDREAASRNIEMIYAVLSPLEQRVCKSYFIDSLSMNETAAENQLSINSVRAAVERIRKRAKRHMNFGIIFFSIAKCIFDFWRTI